MSHIFCWTPALYQGMALQVAEKVSKTVILRSPAGRDDEGSPYFLDFTNAGMLRFAQHDMLEEFFRNLLKPRLKMATFSARLKPCPDTKPPATHS
jgi:hypothetical protein